MHKFTVSIQGIASPVFGLVRNDTNSVAMTEKNKALPFPAEPLRFYRISISS